jgi:hypothetical protein
MQGITRTGRGPHLDRDAAYLPLQASLEKLRTDAAEAALIRDLATDRRKRELFTKLADHLAMLAAEVERAIATQADR